MHFFGLVNPLRATLGGACGHFVATFVVLVSKFLLYRRMVLQLHDVWGGGRKLFISFSFCFVCIFYDGISNAQFDTSCCSTILFDMHAVEPLNKRERTKVSCCQKKKQQRPFNTAQNTYATIGHQQFQRTMRTSIECAGCAMACANDV